MRRRNHKIVKVLQLTTTSTSSDDSSSINTLHVVTSSPTSPMPCLVLAAMLLFGGLDVRDLEVDGLLRCLAGQRSDECLEW